MTSEFSIAVHCLVFLQHRNCCLSSEKIAENVCTNPARIRKILAKLKATGIVETREGPTGGFRLKKPAEEVSLGEVLAAVGEQIVSVNWRSGDEDMPCVIASGMAGVMDELYLEMNKLCVERLKNVTVAEVERKITTKKESSENS